MSSNAFELVHYGRACLALLFCDARRVESLAIVPYSGMCLLDLREFFRYSKYELYIALRFLEFYVGGIRQF